MTSISMATYIIILGVVGGAAVLGGLYGVLWGLRAAHKEDSKVLILQARLARIIQDMSTGQE